MSTKQIVEEIDKLPLNEKVKLMQIMARRMFSEKDQSNALSHGAKALLSDYETDRELTSFAVLDKEEFYEAR